MKRGKYSSTTSVIVGIIALVLVSIGSYVLGLYHGSKNYTFASFQPTPPRTSFSTKGLSSTVSSICKDENLGILIKTPSGWTCNLSKVSDTYSSISLSSGFFNIQISNSPRSEFCVSDPSVYGYNANCTVTTFYSTPSILTAIYVYQGKTKEIYGSVLNANNKQGTPVPWISIKYQNMENNNLSDDQKNGLIGILNSISSL